MNSSLEKMKNKLSTYSRRQRHSSKIWHRIASAALCVVLLSTNMVGALAAETPTVTTAPRFC